MHGHELHLPLHLDAYLHCVYPGTPSGCATCGAAFLGRSASSSLPVKRGAPCPSAVRAARGQAPSKSTLSRDLRPVHCSHRTQQRAAVVYSNSTSIVECGLTRHRTAETPVGRKRGAALPRALHSRPCHRGPRAGVELLRRSKLWLPNQNCVVVVDARQQQRSLVAGGWKKPVMLLVSRETGSVQMQPRCKTRFALSVV